METYNTVDYISDQRIAEMMTKVDAAISEFYSNGSAQSLTPDEEFDATQNVIEGVIAEYQLSMEQYEDLNNAR